jgi:hypothetical protein
MSEGYDPAQQITTIILTANGEFIEHALVDRATVTLLGRYWRAFGDGEPMDGYRYCYVRTLDGMSYRLMSDRDAIQQFFYDMSPESPSYYENGEWG